MSGVAVAVTLAMGAPVSAAPGAQDGHGGSDSLVDVSDNNVGPFQVCNNNVPVNVGGVQVPVSDLTGVLGLGNDGNTAKSAKSCDQASQQDNGADDSNGSLVDVSDNNVGPFQACNNDVPVNVGGVQVPVSDAAGTAGIGNDGNSAESAKDCDQASQQNNDGDGDHSPTPGASEDDSLVRVSDNNVGPFQACNNDVNVNVGGVQVPVGDLTGTLGLTNDGNTTGSLKNCTQASQQNNDTPVDPPVDELPVEDPPVDDTPEEDTPESDTPEGDTPEENTPEENTPEGDTPEVDEDTDTVAAVLPDTGGPAAALLTLGLLGVAGGTFLVARSRRMKNAFL